MVNLTPSQKGAVAEAAVTAAAVSMGVLVLRPVCEGGRYDVAFDLGPELMRVQCKWVSKQGPVLAAYIRTNRYTPHGYVTTTYGVDEVDAIALFSPDTCRCYLLPIEELVGRTMVCLRLGPTRNNQAQGITWAKDYELERVLRLRVEASGRQVASRGAPKALRIVDT